MLRAIFAYDLKEGEQEAFLKRLKDDGWKVEQDGKRLPYTTTYKDFPASKSLEAVSASAHLSIIKAIAKDLNDKIQVKDGKLVGNPVAIDTERYLLVVVDTDHHMPIVGESLYRDTTK